MRDPLGTNEVIQGEFIRKIFYNLPPDHFLRSKLSKQMVMDKQLIDFQIVDDTKIVSPLVPFVSYPYEWCNAQIYDAAQLTCKVSERVLEDNFEIKDASAWNIVFIGCIPCFCDHLSFKKIDTPHWWAFGQFIRHFVLPLCVSKYRALEAYQCFKINRDGIDPKQASSLLGFRRFATWYWPLMLNSGKKGTVVLSNASENQTKKHENLYKLCRWLLKSVSINYKRKSVWSNYTKDREHYSDSAQQLKNETINKWLKLLSPSWVIDLGCNTGEYSKLAAKNGSKVVAVDLDHESIQNLYLSANNKLIFPVVANLDDLLGGKGWSASEFPGLVERLENLGDIVMLLALIHHISISCSVPYVKIAELASKLTKRYLIIEMIGSSDSRAVALALQRNRSVEEFSIISQKEAFSSYFKLLEEVPLTGSERILVLLEKV